MKPFKPTIEHSASLTGAAWLLLVEGLNDLTQDGLTASPIPIQPGDQALFIRGPDGDVVAAMAYSIIKGRTATVSFVYVEPSSRRLGLFRALWEDLMLRAKNADCDNICAEVSAVDTTTLDLFYKKTGSTAQAIRFTRAISK